LKRRRKKGEVGRICRCQLKGRGGAPVNKNITEPAWKGEEVTPGKRYNTTIAKRIETGYLGGKSRGAYVKEGVATAKSVQLKSAKSGCKTFR